MEKIMLIDRDPVNSAISKALLAPLYELIQTKSRLQALGYLKGGSRPDLIILDEMTVGEGGLEVLCKLKQEDSARDIPIIYETTVTDLDLRKKGYQLGAADFILKPVTPVLLLKKIEMQLHIARLERENDTLREKIRLLEEMAWPVSET